MSQLSLALALQRTIQPIAQVIGASSSGGAVELQTLSAHGLLANDVVQIYGVGGTVEANGQFIVASVPDSTHIILANSFYSHAFTSGGDIAHIGFATSPVTVDNVAFPNPVNYELVARLESLSAGSVVRCMFEDATDSAFLTRQPLITADTSDLNPISTSVAPQLDRVIIAAKAETVPDFRIGTTGARLRLLVFTNVPYTTVQLSAWLQY